jgi:hypothetical protein
MSLLHSIKNPTPTKRGKGYSHPASGNVSLFGFYKGRKVKLYQVFDPKQIQLRLEVQRSAVGYYFPEVMDYDEQYVVEEFIESEPSDWNGYEEMFSAMMRLRMIERTPDFDYLAYIYNRVGIDVPKLYNQIPCFVNHNDLTRDNVVVDRYGHPKIIDNDLLACNNGWLLNLYNGNGLFASLNDEQTSRFYQDVDVKLAEDIFNNVRKRFKKPEGNQDGRFNTEALFR